VKLASWSDLVKPDRAAFAAAASTAVSGVLVVWLVLTLTNRQDERLAIFGEALARSMAELAVEPLIRDDRMHLGVIGNRLTEASEIRGAATYDADLRQLASTGTLPAPYFTQPVVVDAEIVGYVRVSVDPQAFAASHPARLPALLVTALLLPWLVAVGTTLFRVLRSTAGHRRHTAIAEGDDREALPAATAEPLAPAMTRHYLLAVNLYNQLSLQPTEREFELSLCSELADTVATGYQGQVVALPGVGALLDFDDTSNPDRPFEVVRAAFLLARLLREETPFGTYRLGLHLTECPADRALPLDDPAVADAALLSALARDHSLAVSQPFTAALSGTERLTSHTLVNPLLDELTSSGSGCALITGLAPEIGLALAQEVEALRSQRDETISPSTL
jgi:uncharacterized membrane protein affecting hemolysin expression